MWTKISIDPHFSATLQQCAFQRLQMQQFREAELALSKKVMPEIRNDKIFWLDAKSETLHKIESSLLMALDELCVSLKQELHVYLDSTECHYALYEIGHFYKRHRDSTSQNNKRIFSFTLYLNNEWKDNDGGNLIGYDGQKILFSVKPEIGTMILFRSDIEHEVLPTTRDRLSITGWFRQ